MTTKHAQWSVKAMALATGIIWSSAVLCVGLVNLASPDYGTAFLDVASSIYPGYQAGEGIGSVLIGTGYALLDGAVGGAVFAWIYNRFAS